jgi:hypothetical protein
LVEHAQVHALLLKLLRNGVQVRRRPSQPIKLGHDKRVALAHEAQHLGQLGPIILRFAADRQA